MLCDKLTSFQDNTVIAYPAARPPLSGVCSDINHNVICYISGTSIMSPWHIVTSSFNINANLKLTNPVWGTPEPNGTITYYSNVFIRSSVEALLLLVLILHQNHTYCPFDRLCMHTLWNTQLHYHGRRLSRDSPEFTIAIPRGNTAAVLGTISRMLDSREWSFMIDLTFVCIRINLLDSVIIDVWLVIKMQKL